MGIRRSVLWDWLRGKTQPQKCTLARLAGFFKTRRLFIAKQPFSALEIVNGLSATDQIVVNPSDSQSDGMKGHVVELIVTSKHQQRDVFVSYVEQRVQLPGFQ
jgi:transcriptional regulator with XRE-family HTH domain